MSAQTKDKIIATIMFIIFFIIWAFVNVKQYQIQAQNLEVSKSNATTIGNINNTLNKWELTE